jgi:hypothetical protein
MDPTSPNLASIVTVDQSFQVRQLGSDAKAARYYEDTLIPVHSKAAAVQSSKEDQGIKCIYALSVM